MISSTSSLHSPHQELNTVLQEMLGSLRDVMSAKRQEMDSLQLPHERARVDITIHDRYNCMQYSIIETVCMSVLDIHVMAFLEKNHKLDGHNLKN